MNQWVFLNPFPIYKSEVFCTCCEEHNIRKQLASTVAKSDPVCHKTSWLLSPLLHITISSSIWKSWRQRSLVFATFYPSNCSNISLSVSLLFCVMIYCPHRGWSKYPSSSNTSILWPFLHTIPRAMICLKVFFIISLWSSWNQIIAIGPVIVIFIIYQYGQALVSNSLVKH